MTSILSIVALQQALGLELRKLKQYEKAIRVRVSIGINLQSGPWGGGNQVGRALVDYLQQEGVEVSHDLNAPDLDMIVLTEPRANLRSSAYTDRQIFQYIREVNPRAIVVHRVNECDERKGTTDVNQILRRANLCADHTVFVSTWVKDLHLQQGMRCKSYSVIHNGSDQTIFHAKGYRRWDGKQPLKLVTHHWGGHWMKGFDIYERVDRLLAFDRYKERFLFTYVGRIPNGFRFQNATYLKPKHGQALAAMMRKHHVYLTASHNEPGANHQNEGANCGLPLLYIESGCMPEYCGGFGISFTAENFEQKLEEMMETYDHLTDRMKHYPHTAEKMCKQYHNLFVELLERRDEILGKRRRWRWPLWLLKPPRFRRINSLFFKS